MKNAKRLIFFVIFIVAIIIIYFSFADYLTFNLISKHQAYLLERIHNNYILAVSAFIGIYCIMGVFLIPGITVLTVASGFLFNAVPGVLYSIIGGTMGAAGSFIALRYFLGAPIYKKYHDKIEKFSNKYEKYGIFYLAALKAFPFIPTSLTNIFGSLVPITLLKYIAVTAISLLPRVVFYIIASDHLIY